MHERAFAFSLLLRYTKAALQTRAKKYGLGLSIADELVTLEGGGDLIRWGVFKDGFPDPFGAQDLSDTAQVDGLRPVVVQRDHIFDRAAKIRLAVQREQHTAGTDVLGESGKRDPFGTKANDGQRKLQLETPSSSLFHYSV